MVKGPTHVHALLCPPFHSSFLFSFTNSMLCVPPCACMDAWVDLYIYPSEFVYHQHRMTSFFKLSPMCIKSVTSTRPYFFMLSIVSFLSPLFFTFSTLSPPTRTHIHTHTPPKHELTHAHFLLFLFISLFPYTITTTTLPYPYQPRPPQMLLRLHIRFYLPRTLLR